MTPRLLTASIAGVVLFTGACLLLHILEPGLDPIQDAVSYYMNQPSGWILTLGLIALGVGSMSLGVAVGRTSLDATSTAGRRLLFVWSIGVLVGGIFRPDPMGHWDRPPTFSGIAHGGAALAAFLAFPAAAILLSPSLSRVAGLSRCLRPLAIAAAACLVVFFLCLAPGLQNRPPYVLGFVERILLALIVAWLALAGRSVMGVSGKKSRR